MEISKVNSASVKLKGKNASVVVDPSVKIDAEIVILTNPSDTSSVEKVEGKRLIIAGPGEYEVGGVSITGRASKGGTTYLLLEQSKVLLTLSSAIAHVPDDEEFDCLLIKINGELSKDSLGPINAKCVVLFGDVALSKMKLDDVETSAKISLKKTAEIQGKTFVIS